MKRTPSIYKLENLFNMVAKNEISCGLPDGRWVPARPIGFWSIRYRLRAAWLVWTGRADAVVWPGDQ